MMYLENSLKYPAQKAGIQLFHAGYAFLSYFFDFILLYAP